ncbi:unnamed protein product [Staurois parvus]|uniref:Chemokine interleukin-8-like domain-containing protein n=1 Tax=Staurois parvus TaxID=386267 RepID=A0ABN9C8U6_9NEOB|nr:unnamed protein product [Staurois parvus]
MLTPSCPVPLVQCHCFLLALITVLVSHVSDTKSVPPQCQNVQRLKHLYPKWKLIDTIKNRCTCVPSVRELSEIAEL